MWWHSIGFVLFSFSSNFLPLNTIQSWWVVFLIEYERFSVWLSLKKKYSFNFNYSKKHVEIINDWQCWIWKFNCLYLNNLHFFKLMGVSECPYFFELVEEIRNSEQIKNINRNFRVWWEMFVWDYSKKNCFSYRNSSINWKTGQDH